MDKTPLRVLSGLLGIEVAFKSAQVEVECVMRERPDDLCIQAGLWLWFLIKLGEIFHGTFIFLSWNFSVSWIFRIVYPLKLLQRKGILT